MQMSYALSQPVGVEGSLGEIDRHWVRSYVNGTSIKKRYTITVGLAADEELTVTITDANGIATAVSYDEGAAGTVTTKRNGLVAAINLSLARTYVHAYPKDADEFYIEAKQAGTDFTAAESETNLTITNDVAFVAHPVIPFGLAVALGAQDNECRRPAAISDKILGVAVFTHADQPNDGVPGYKTQSAVSVLRRGCIIARPETNVVAEDPVYTRAVAAGTERAGAFRNSADGTDTILLPGYRWLTTASAGQLAWLSVNVDASDLTALQAAIVDLQAQIDALP